MVGGEEEVLWGVGDASDDEEGQDEDVDHDQHPLYRGSAALPNGGASEAHGEEGVGLLHEDFDFPVPPPVADPFRDNLEGSGDRHAPRR